MTAPLLPKAEGAGWLFIFIAVSQVAFPLLLAALGAVMALTDAQVPQIFEFEPGTARNVFGAFATVGALCLPANFALRRAMLTEEHVKARYRNVEKVYRHYVIVYLVISTLCQVPAALALVHYVFLGGSVVEFVILCVYAAALGVAFLPSRRRLDKLMRAVAPPAEVQP
jgi:hypothetical protein